MVYQFSVNFSWVDNMPKTNIHLATLIAIKPFFFVGPQTLSDGIGCLSNIEATLFIAPNMRYVIKTGQQGFGAVYRIVNTARCSPLYSDNLSSQRNNHPSCVYLTIPRLNQQFNDNFKKRRYHNTNDKNKE